MTAHAYPAPVERRLFTPGVMVLLALMGVGILFALLRFLFGIGAVSNLNDQFAWGLWVGLDVVTGVALAAGGFTTSALAYVFHRDQFHHVVRPALLTAMLGYTFVSIGLFVDIGRYWNIWRPMISWNPRSVLFEVALCVMFYLAVLYIEFIPIFLERFRGRVSLPGGWKKHNLLVEAVLDLADGALGRVMFLFIIAGIVLSFLHQSALGSLMLIAAYKVHPLWYTPILPLLFLLSAIAVGYPMVVFESLLAARSLKREPEMEVMTPLARFMPVLVGLYLVFKLGDMFARGTYVYLLDGTLQSNAFLVEVLCGLILPFILLLFRRVRESAGWLFFASTLYVLGVVVNRMNVFIVSYTPPYMTERYFPAVGEMAITVGLVAGLIFLYRVFVTFFPIIGGEAKAKAPLIAAVLALSFIFLSQTSVAGAQAEADNEKRAIPAQTYMIPSMDDAPMVRMLHSPVVNQYSDLYGPVRFMHRKHANTVKDCTICHHRMPREEGDRYGQPATMAALTRSQSLPKNCGSCHDHPFDPRQIHVPGLKGAYHRLCMNCHRGSEQKPRMNEIGYRLLAQGYLIEPGSSGRAPVDCLSCHAKKVPDHRDLVKVEGKAETFAITKNCLSCHSAQGEAVMATTHWKWQGPSPMTQGHERRVDLGKKSLTINNTTLALSGNWPACTGCHAGYGWKDETFDFQDMSRIDCLVCHDTTGAYRKAPAGAGMPEASVDLLRVAQGVGGSSRATCGACHFSGGTADVLKHGAMNPKLLAPGRNLDVHMAAEGQNIRCVECHRTRAHRISGSSVSVPAVEGVLSCQGCHTDGPHAGGSLLSDHLNRHTDHVACQTCHIPVFGKGTPTMTRWDWSTAGKESKNGDHGEEGRTHRGEFGSFVWKETVKPAYAWYNGTVSRTLAGDRLPPNGAIELNRPLGSPKDPASRIYPFKRTEGKQISDALHRFLVPPKLWDGYWKDGDWDKAAEEGASANGLAYSGKHEFVETIAYHGLNHEVLPKERALSCAACHPALSGEASCGRCHKQSADTDFKALARRGIDFSVLAKEGHDAGGLVGQTDYIDFKALGYGGDPIEVGGRFKSLPLAMKEAPNTVSVSAGTVTGRGKP